ncbi:hypothetical protein BH09SUM1_BH09SUM1_11920 [soil metagenome]
MTKQRLFFMAWSPGAPRSMLSFHERLDQPKVYSSASTRRGEMEKEIYSRSYKHSAHTALTPKTQPPAPTTPSALTSLTRSPYRRPHRPQHGCEHMLLAARPRLRERRRVQSLQGLYLAAKRQPRSLLFGRPAITAGGDLAQQRRNLPRRPATVSRNRSQFIMIGHLPHGSVTDGE